MKLFIDGKWRDGKQVMDVRSPYDNAVVGTAAIADQNDVEDAIVSAQKGAALMEAMPYYTRSRILKQVGELLTERIEAFATTICKENGKTLTEARFEMSRAINTLFIAADAVKDIFGETLPLAAYESRNVEKKFGFTFRVPCGLVLAITPYNMPVSLACHKLASAIAAGNAVIFKPASDTPLSGGMLVDAFLDAGLPPEAIQCVTGSGSKMGAMLCPDQRIRAITFTGSYAVGNEICKLGGLKKVTMELGGNAPVIVMPDADIDVVAASLVPAGYGMSGQACVSTQRVFAHKDVYEALLDKLTHKINALVQGNPLDERTTMGPMIRETDAETVSGKILEAGRQGARLLGNDAGQRHGNFVKPAVVADVTPSMRIFSEELFGPAIAFIPFTDLEDAINGANDTPYGLSAGLFTQHLETAMQITRRVRSGIMHINDSSRGRVDHMPNGGLGQSGLGLEGPRYAIEELTESRTVIMHLEGRSFC